MNGNDANVIILHEDESHHKEVGASICLNDDSDISEVRSLKYPLNLLMRRIEL
jgi:hypothetical protein